MKTASTLIQEIKLRGNFPSDGDFLYKNDGEILILLNAVLKNDLIPFYIENEPSYMLTYTDRAIGKARAFMIPSEAHNRRLYEVRLLHQTGVEENVPYLPFKALDTGSALQEGMRIVGNNIELLGYGERINELKLRIWYHRKGYELVLDSETVPLTQAYTEGERQRFTAPGATFPFAEQAPVLIQNRRDPSQIQEDVIAFVTETGDFALGRTEADSSVRYSSDDILCPAKKLNIPELPEVATELLLLKTLLSMALTTETRYRIRDQFKHQHMLFEKSLKKRVRMETPVKTDISPLWL